MKLILAIVSNDDSGAVSSALTRGGFSVTKLATKMCIRDSDERKVFALRDGAVHDEHDAGGDDRQHLDAGKQIADAPVDAHHVAEAYPEVGEEVVLLIEFIFFKTLAAERAHHAHAGQVFLHHGGQLAFGFIRNAEAVAHDDEEDHGIPHDDRDKNKGDKRELCVHGEHQDE